MNWEKIKELAVTIFVTNFIKSFLSVGGVVLQAFLMNSELMRMKLEAETTNSTIVYDDISTWTLSNWGDLFAVFVAGASVIVFFWYLAHLKNSSRKMKAMFILVSFINLASVSFLIGPHFDVNLTPQYFINFNYDFSQLQEITFLFMLGIAEVAEARAKKKDR